MLETSKSEAVLVSVRAFLSSPESSPFKFKPAWASVISGNEEGGFGWIAFNYLKKIIGPKKTTDSTTPYAVIEMGGASAQVNDLLVLYDLLLGPICRTFRPIFRSYI